MEILTSFEVAAQTWLLHKSFSLETSLGRQQSSSLGQPAALEKLPAPLPAPEINSAAAFGRALPDTETVWDLTPCFSLLASLENRSWKCWMLDIVHKHGELIPTGTHWNQQGWASSPGTGWAGGGGRQESPTPSLWGSESGFSSAQRASETWGAARKPQKPNCAHF